MITNLRSKIYFSLLFLFAGLISILCCEMILKISHYRIKPYWEQYKHQKNEPVVNQPDSFLGWRLKPGHYIIPAYAEDGKAIKYTLWPNGARATGLEYGKVKKRNVVFIGGSLTQGWAVSDEETFVWKLQKKFPLIRFINLAVVGYGTYQALLYLEDFLRKSTAKPVIVIYGFIGHHAYRNVANIDWLFDLSHQARRLRVEIPYCLIGENNKMQCYAPEGYPHWFMDKKLGVVNFLKDFYLKSRFRKRDSQAEEVTKRLILKLKNLCRFYQANFFVVNLHGEAFRNNYKEFLKQEGIKAADCYNPIMNSREMKVPGEGHPNGKIHTLWAECIEQNFKQDFIELIQGKTGDHG